MAATAICHAWTVEGQAYLRWWCPGCGHEHWVPTKAMSAAPAVRGWGFDGNMAAPTLSPSVRHYRPAMKDRHGVDQPEVTTCHYFIQGGKIVFCGDCQHALNGQTVDLQPYESEAAR